MKRAVLQTMTDHDADGWWCVCVIADPDGPKVQQSDLLRVGPFPSRQVAKRELTGKFRECIQDALREFIRESRIQSISYDGIEQAIELLEDHDGHK